VVERWEARFGAWLGEVDRRRKAGEATEEELAPLVRLERTAVRYDLMMAGFPESFPPDTPEPAGDGTGRLAAAAAALLDRPVEMVIDAVTSAVTEGHLVRRSAGGSSAWRWRERL
jgi:hypothetical protein